MKNRWEMEGKQSSKYAFHISCLNEKKKSCQEPLIACCKGLSVPSEFPSQQRVSPLGSRLVYHKQMPESAGSHPTQSPGLGGSTT